MRPTLLQRQLRRNGLSADCAPTLEQWKQHLESIERTYEDFNQDRYTLERSLAISSDEMRRLYDDLKSSSESALAAEHAKLRRSLAIHEAILEAAVDGVLVVDEQRQVISQSRRFIDLWRLSPGDVTATTTERATPRVADPEGFLSRIEQIHTSDESTQDEIELLDGRVLDRVSAPIRSESGQSHGRVWFFRDVTVRKQQADRIREANRFLDSIVENIPHMVFVKEAETLRLVRLNRAGEQLLGRSQDELIGKCEHELFAKDRADSVAAEDRRVLAQHDVVTIDEQPIETPLGRRWLRTKKIPIVDSSGNPLYLLGISEDITDALAKRTELMAAKETAEKASRAKSDFLLNMSHEMRTPLNAILGFARILKRELRLEGNHGEYLQAVVHASEHMLALVNDLLDLRGLEETTLEMSRVELRPVIESTISLLRPLIDQRGLALTVNAADELPKVVANQRAVAQILINLLSNAAKFTPEGGSVSVDTVVTASRVHISVRDTGVGIAPEDQPKLFTYFEQVGDKHAHQMKGSGVGLALTRALVERHGGTISVRSAAGSGSTFKFDLEVAP